MNALSLFSGVGGFDLGLERAGMTTVAQVEWDAKCQQVLARHWPDVPRWGDVSDVNASDLPDCDLVAFGSPCQDLSVAGKRGGMVEGETRSGLFYEAIRIIKELQDERRGPAWVVWENVVGALSSNRGHDFAAVLDSLADLGAVDIQWRVLDAQWFGVPQRRRRVFVVARLDLGAAGQPEVLPVGASVRRDPAPSSETGPVVAALTANGVGAGGGPDDNAAQAGHLIAARESGQGYWMEDDLAGPLRAEQGGVPSQIVADSRRYRRQRERGDSRSSGDGRDAVTGSASRRTQRPGRLQRAAHSDVPDITGTVTTTWAKGPGNTQVEEGHVEPVMAFGWQENQTAGTVWQDEVPGLTTTKTYAIARCATEGGSLAVRRLTPRECERQRLMGWPDDWTRWTADGTEIADSNRYRMCGNGVAAPVAEWVGRCIVNAEADR